MSPTAARSRPKPKPKLCGDRCRDMECELPAGHDSGEPISRGGQVDRGRMHRCGSVEWIPWDQLEG